MFSKQVAAVLYSTSTCSYGTYMRHLPGLLRVEDMQAEASITRGLRNGINRSHNLAVQTTAGDFLDYETI